MKKLFGFFTQTPEAQKGSTSSGRKTVSHFIIGTNEINIQSANKRLASLNIAPPETLNDSLLFIIHCPRHKTMALSLTQHNNGAFASWLPFIYLSPTVGWFDSIDEGMAMILSYDKPSLREDFKARKPWEANILTINRTQLPHTQRFFTRITALVKLNEKIKDDECCHNTERFLWLEYDRIKQGVKNDWGQLSRYVVTAKIDLENVESYQTDVEYDLEWLLKYVPRDPPRNEEEDMLRCLNITEKHIERAYIDFLEHCFPSTLLSFYSFKNYFVKYGFIWDDSRMFRFFNAFGSKSTGVVVFHDLLLGMACIEPDVYNGEARIKFIFRFYDVNRDGFLNETEFKVLVKDINPTMADNELNDEVGNGMKLMNATLKGVAMKDFIGIVGQNKFRGTSTLCRSKRPIFSAILNAIASRGVKANPELKKTVVEYVDKKKYDGVCKICKNGGFQIAPHSFKIGPDGRASDFQLLTEIKDVLKKQSTIPPKNPYLSQKYLMEVTLNPKCLAFHLLEEIRAFNAVKGTKDEPKGFCGDNKEQREAFVKLLGQLAKDVIPILESEDRCVRVKAPAFVIGDIHGNLEDLLSIEKYLFKSVPIINANYVFLGDYVDRGKWSVECAVYVLCLKLLCPANFFILRGNHETRVLQELYTFKKECKQKYQSFGSTVFETLNSIFERLPLAAVVDDSIFCCHGGIPASTSTIEGINKVKNKLKDVENESSVAWEILWDDPVDKKEFKQTVALLQKREDISRGFVANQRRGTAFFFNELACQEFLKTNKLLYMIRAHEVPLTGFKFHYEKKCLTIFSCSHYCGQNNKAAVVHISDQTLRVIELDTTNNAPATDNPYHKSKH